MDNPPLLKCDQLITMLESGVTLNKIQARHAFAMYLQRVQQRLLQERMPATDKSAVAEPEDLTANEQMDLVLRFLKRAASNLHVSHPSSSNASSTYNGLSSTGGSTYASAPYQGNGFRVVIPSRKLPLLDRKRILAKQLGDFVNLYNRETDLLDKKLLLDKRVQNNKSQIPHDQFELFLRNASESDLEDLLTTYTRLNKSARIFLGGASSSASASIQQVSTSYVSTTVTGIVSKGTSSSDSINGTDQKGTSGQHESSSLGASTTSTEATLNNNNESLHQTVSSIQQIYTKTKTSAPLSVYSSPSPPLYYNSESGGVLDNNNTEVIVKPIMTALEEGRAKKDISGPCSSHRGSTTATPTTRNVGFDNKPSKAPEGIPLTSSQQRVSPIGCEAPEQGSSSLRPSTPVPTSEVRKSFLQSPNNNPTSNCLKSDSEKHQIKREIWRVVEQTQ